MPKGIAHPELLLEEYGVVIISPLGVFTDKRKGPIPIIEWLNQKEIFKDSYVIIKKINLAIAWILLKGEVKEIYVKSITDLAKRFLDKYKLNYQVEEIDEPESEDDLCKWDKALKDIDDEKEAFKVIEMMYQNH